MQMLKKWIKLCLLWLGLIALVLFHYVSGITPLILKADTFDSYENYSEYVVTDFNDYKEILKPTTDNLQFYIMAQFSTKYQTQYCPINGLLGDVQLFISVWDTSNTINMGFYDVNLPDINCIQPYEQYTYTIEIPLQSITTNENYIEIIKQSILSSSDDLRIRTFAEMTIKWNNSAYGYNTTFTNSHFKTWFEIRFNNTYLLSTFLLEIDYHSNNFNATYNRPFVLYAETVNDRYNVFNNELSDVSARTKYAITIPNIETALLANKIGSGWESFKDISTITMSSTQLYWRSVFYLYTLNASPMATPFDDVAIDNTPNYSVCDYALGFPIDCTLDGVPIGSFQAMTNDLWEWTIKESPIFSDVWTLASGGFQWLSNTFQFLGYFDVDSLLGGVLALLIGVIVMLWAWVGG